MAPQWLIYLPPTMSPVETSQREGWLERPEEAFAHYRERGVAEVVCEEKHMGSRALVLVCRDEAAAQRRFGAAKGETGCDLDSHRPAVLPERDDACGRRRSRASRSR